MQELKLRWATGKGDLILWWKDKELKILGRMATPEEEKRLTTWAKEQGLTIEGDLAQEATIHADPDLLKRALTDLVKKDVQAVGYVVYGVNKKGKGKVLAHHSEVELEKFTEVARVPQVKGG